MANKKSNKTKYAVGYGRELSGTELYDFFPSVDKALDFFKKEAEYGETITVYAVTPIKKGKIEMTVKDLKNI